MSLHDILLAKALSGGGSGGGTPNAVQYTAQELTEAQQMQARANLGLYRKEGGVIVPAAPLTMATVGEGENAQTIPMIPGFIPVVGQTYTVTWDGTDYTCTAVEQTTDGETAVILGNLGFITDTGYTSEPFMMGYVANLIEASGVDGVMVVSAGDIGETIPVVGISGETIHKIDPQYLPEGIGYVGKSVVFDGRPEFDESAGWHTVPNFIIELGMVYDITFNGTVYHCEALDVNDSGMPSLGNASVMLPELMDTGEPFFMTTYNGRTMMRTTATETPTVKIVCEKVHKIPNEYLPTIPLIITFAGLDGETGAALMSHTATDVLQLATTGGIAFLTLEGFLLAPAEFPVNDGTQYVKFVCITNHDMAAWLDDKGRLFMDDPSAT